MSFLDLIQTQNVLSVRQNCLGHKNLQNPPKQNQMEEVVVAFHWPDVDQQYILNELRTLSIEDCPNEKAFIHHTRSMIC
jgi:hypothetical protein